MKNRDRKKDIEENGKMHRKDEEYKVELIG